jgi:glycosyltransferase involved in cell wall biosynthesis
MTQPHVSIIIPTYNHGHLIGDCLDSLRSQTIDDWEAIVVNNFSTDNTEEVISKLNDPRIQVVTFKNNGVIAASRNRGAKVAKSAFLAFLDSDDIWYPNKLELCLNGMQTGYTILCHAERWVGENGLNRIVRYGPTNRAKYERLLFDGNCLSTSAVILSTDLFNSVGGFSEDPSFITAEDYDLWLRISLLGNDVGFINDVLGEYRLHGGNQSGVAERHYDAVVSVLNWHFSKICDFGALGQTRIRRRISLASYGCARMLQDNNNFNGAYYWLRKAIAGWPFSIKPWLALMLNVVNSKW